MLANFPVEILNVILSVFSLSQSVIELWKCGDKGLNYRIIHGGCRDIDFEDLKDNSKARLPRLIFSLHQLRSLRISRGKWMFTGVFELRDLLLQLPPTIESLNLTCKEAEACLFLHPVLDPNHGCCATSSNTPTHLLSYLERDPTSESPLWDIEAKFPLLRCLSVSAAADSIIGPYCQFLPSTLTNLTITAPLNSFESESQLKIPKNVVSLSLNLPVLPDLRLLPPTLETFNTFNDWEYLDDLYRRKRPKVLAVSILPPNLTETDIVIPWSPSLPGALPPNLTRMIVKADDSKVIEPVGRLWTQNMPQKLVDLRLPTVCTDGPCLRSFPPSITKILVKSLNWRTIPDSTCFPSSLIQITVLSIYGHYTEKDISKLPKQLTYLEIPPSKEDMQACLSAMPPCLKTLKIQPYNFPANTHFHFPTLPRTLTHFDYPQGEFFGLSPPGDQLAELKIIHIGPVDACFPFQMLPPHLHTFNCVWFDPAAFRFLPRFLQVLNTKPSKMLTREHLKELPSTLTSLELPQATMSTTDVDLFSVLPDSLTKLDAGWTLLPTDMLSYLPKRLKRLVCSVTWIKDAMFKRLPVTLLDIKIHSWVKETTSHQGVSAHPFRWFARTISSEWN